MSKITRRSFVAGAAAIPFVVWAERHALAQAPRVRYDARSTKGQAMLRLYSQGVDRMMKLDPCDPRSWVFQWYTHWVKGTGSPAEKTAAIAEIYKDPTKCPAAWKALAQSNWDTCQPHFGGINSMFLPWHRMFVYFFETIVRSASGNSSFTLPYWNYSTSDTKIRGVIPSEFGTGGLAPLFVSKRNTGVNGGKPIQQGQPGNPLSLDSLAQCQYLPSTTQPGFNNKLDNGLHGNVHDLVGNTQNMGAVPWAAGDPIFWMHHSNIDRLWASWNAAGRQNPNDPSWLGKTFIFADDKGQQVIAKVGDFLDIAKLGYSYDRLEPVPSCPPTLKEGAALKRHAVVKATPIPLGPGPVRVNLEAAPEAGDAAAPLGAKIQALEPERRLYLIIRGLRAEVAPGVLYHLYLELPEQGRLEQHEDLHVGHLSFFEAAGHSHSGHEAAGGEPASFFSFDVTALAKRLQARNQLGASLSLTIVPVGQPAAEAKPVIGEISLVEE